MTPEDLERMARESAQELSALPTTSQPLWYRSLADKSPRLMGISATYGKEGDPKPIQEIGEIISFEKTEEGFFLYMRFDDKYLEWLTKPQNRLEDRPWWYPFTRIKKLLSRS